MKNIPRNINEYTHDKLRGEMCELWVIEKTSGEGDTGTARINLDIAAEATYY